MSDTPSNPTDAAAIAVPEPQPTAQQEFIAGTPIPVWAVPPTAPHPRRTPNFLDLGLLSALLLGGLLCAIIAIVIAVGLHLFGVARVEDAMHSMRYAIGTMVVWYAIAFVPAFFTFPALWGKSFLAGLQWNAAAPRRLWPWLMAAGVGCFLLALSVRRFLHFPDHSPIDGLLSTPQAVWIMFAFAISVAPLCEEIMFRGFLLPALSTAFDWTGEKLAHHPPRPLLVGDHPQWSLPAMVLASILTSAIFAVFHMGQNGKALGPLILIFSVSLVLCAVRLAARSLAASALTHATYNCTLFVIMAIGTHGFHNLHK